MAAMADRRKRLHEEIEELFADLWPVHGFSGLHRGFRPNVDSYLTDDPPELTVKVDLPGVDPTSLKVVAHERTLVVAGERGREKVEGAVYQQMEIEVGPFRRQIRLSNDVDPERAHARYDRGVLTVTLPVIEQPVATADRFLIVVSRS